MKLSLNTYCYNDAILIDNKPVDDIDVIGDATKQLIKYIVDNYGVENLFKELMGAYGNYEFEEGNYCEICGNSDTIINLEI